MSKQYSKDLTEGSILKNLISFSIPLLLGNILQVLYNTVDSIWVGRFIGSDALGAVSVSFPIIMILISLVMGITMATTVLVSQYAGAKNEDMVLKTVNNSLLLLGSAAIVVTIIGLIFSEKILLLMNTPPEILEYSTQYLNIFFFGLIFMFGYNVISSILRGLGDSKTPLRFLIVTTVLNLILDPFLIIGIGPFPQMGIRGAAVATLISQGISFMLALRHLDKQNHVISLKLKNLKFDKELTLQTIKIGLPAGIQQVVTSLGMVVLTSIINSFGADTIAAYGAASRLNQFAYMPAMSLGLAVSTLTGQSIGANKSENIKEIYKWGNVSATVITGITTIFVIVAPTLVLKLFTDDAQVLEIGSSILRIVGITYVPFALMFITNGILRGAGDTFPTMVFSIVSLWVIRVPLAKYLSSMDSLGSNGIWMAIAISSVLSLLMSQVYYATGRWKSKTLVKNNKLKEAEA
ncbi:MATE family efflux transporter [Sporosalibacterium faouarense]|uniref:MATE family efflux transporter n=1 Tax=Sporosalibacterium faouarense TaxID=516123 RepID=UPI00141C9571|nr:MATE family efflux transporter [Sporosalibacterium faouarense]MTI49564.1 MATE family efflux transporter [Bacillota bacterium]